MVTIAIERVNNQISNLAIGEYCVIRLAPWIGFSFFKWGPSFIWPALSNVFSQYRDS